MTITAQKQSAPAYRFRLHVPPLFSFWRTVYSHGWCALPPFHVDKENRAFSRLLEVARGTLVDCRLTENDQGISVLARSTSPLTAAQKKQVREQLSSCLRLDEDLTDFYTEARRDSRYRWIARAGAGRMLRSPTVFEDVVKMICTTNCSWALTEVMIGNLTTLLGAKHDGGQHAFPSANALAGTTETYLRKYVRAGYRSPYLLEFAEAVAGGQIDPESWRTSALPTGELYNELKRVKGMGDYSAGNILKLLGRYDYLGLDSWVRARFFELYTGGRRVKDSTIEKTYAPLGKWRGLFFWLEMTRHWFSRKFPF